MANPDDPRRKPKPGPNEPGAGNVAPDTRPEPVEPSEEGEVPADPGATVALPAFDPGATVAMPALDPGATAAMPPLDPGATVAMPALGADPNEADQLVDDDDRMVGQLLMGKWRILKKLGAGSFGTVYKVEDIKGGWVEALKILSVDRLSGIEAQSARIRFLREAQIMKRLGTESQHIVGLSTYEEDLEAGLIYFTMEMVDGKSLADVIDDDGPMSVERTVRLALQVCDALTIAHEGADGIVHRDLKLENLMLTKDRAGEEIIKVLDFGIAKIAERETDKRLTTVGTLGTPGYAAPEQLRAEDVDARTDLFAFGVILYSLLTGLDPWLGNPAAQPTHQIYELMVQTERGEVRPMSETGVSVPPAMESIVLRLLRRDPADRYATAKELKEALKRIEAGGAALEAATLRVLTDDPGVDVVVRSGRQTVAAGPTPCVADDLGPGTYKVQIRDPRFEPVETSVTLAAGALQDVTLVTTARSTGAVGKAKRNLGMVAAVVVLVVAGAAAAVLQPWGRSLSLEDLVAKAASGQIASARLAAEGVEGRLTIAGLPAPFRVELPAGERAAAVNTLRASGLELDTSWEVRRLVARAVAAQNSTRYFGSEGDDVRSYAEQAIEFDPESREARSLLRKVAERMAWDAQAARADGAPEQADALVDECLALIPAHPSCVAAGEAR